MELELPKVCGQGNAWPYGANGSFETADFPG